MRSRTSWTRSRSACSGTRPSASSRGSSRYGSLRPRRFGRCTKYPGDPFIGEKAVSPEVEANLKARWGLDKPPLEQYWIFLTNMVQGDFGISFAQESRSVNDIILERFPVSAILGILAIVFAGLGGVLYGALTALYRNQWPDVLIILLVIIGISVPSFVFASVGQLVLVVINQILGFTLLPVAGWGRHRPHAGASARAWLRDDGVPYAVDAVVHAGDRERRLHSNRAFERCAGRAGVLAPPVAQCGATRHYRLRSVGCFDYDRWIRR